MVGEQLVISLPVMVFMTHRPGVIVSACGKHALSATLTEKLLRAFKYNSCVLLSTTLAYSQVQLLCALKYNSSCRLLVQLLRALSTTLHVDLPALEERPQTNVHKALVLWTLPARPPPVSVTKILNRKMHKYNKQQMLNSSVLAKFKICKTTKGKITDFAG